MANQTITQLPDAGPIQGDELVPIVQNGGTYKTTASALAGSPVQTQTFLTQVNEPTLNNSRYLSTDSNLSLTDGGAQSFLRINLSGAAASLNSSGNGFQVKTGLTTVVPRSITVTTSGLSITNGDGVSGDPQLALTGQVLSLANASGAGLVALPNNGTVTPRSIVGVASEISVTNGNGAAGNPSVGIASDAVLPGTGGVTLPIGTIAERIAGTPTGVVRYNLDTQRFEGFGTSWATFGTGDGTVTSVNASGGSTGLSFVGGPITTSGTLTLTGTPVKADNVAGGDTNKLVYQTATDISGFIDAPTLTDTFLKWTGSNFTWAALPGAGTVTSVGLSLPSDFTVSGSPVTSSGTLSATWASQAANRIFAAPDGTSGTPTFRAMVNADLPLSGVTANTYGSSNAIPVITVNDKGVITSVTTAGIVGGLDYKGGWNASTNTPTLASGVGVNGNYYVVTTAGSTNLDGITDWAIGDWAIFNGTAWQKIDQTNTVSSVNGYTGAVTLTYTDVGAPSTSGTGATGTWAIDISGNAATATSATSASSATSATTATNLAGGTANQIPYQTGAGATSFITAPVTSGHFLKWNGSAFTWDVAGTGTVTSVNVSGGTTGLTTSGGPVTSSGTITLAGTLITPNGGTGLSTYTAGDLLYYNAGDAFTKLAIGASTYMLTSNGSAPQWTAPSSITVGSATSANAVANSVTFTTTGGASPGATFNGSSAQTIDYSTVGAPKADGTGASGTWGINISGNAATATSATSATTATTATNANNVATTNTGTNANFYIPFVAASTTGNQSLGVDAGLSYNPSTNAITSGISGGTF